MFETFYESILRWTEKNKARKIYFSRATRRQRVELEKFDRWLRRGGIDEETPVS